MSTHKAKPQQVCPECGGVFAAHLNVVDDRAPAPGDYTICDRCFLLCVFNDDLTLRGADQQEMEEALKIAPFPIVVLDKGRAN